MNFSSPTFLFLFLPLVLLGHRGLPAVLRNFFLLLVSLFFYAWGEGTHFSVLIASIGVNYVFARMIAGLGPGRSGTVALLIGLAFNVGLLGYYKHLVAQAGVQSLPLGLSFFTLQGMSYLLDVSWGLVRVETNLLRFALYIALFPQLIAGPIVRYQEVEQALEARVMRLDQVAQGARRFIVGLGKKVLLADTLATYVDLFFHPNVALTPGLAWLGVVSFALQIYCDFSGYSDMAIGIGQMLGFELPENFRHPYVSRSIREFWRRWHMTLSRWLTNYLVTPTSRLLKGQLGMRLAVVGFFLLTGIWHGATDNFLVFGLIHGVMVVMESGPFMRTAAWVKRLPLPVGWLYCQLIVLISMVFFRGANLEQSSDFLGAMLGQGADEGAFFLTARLDSLYWLTLAVAALTSTPIAVWLEARFAERGQDALWRVLELGWLALLLGLCWMWIAASGHQSFIYFQY